MSELTGKLIKYYTTDLGSISIYLDLPSGKKLLEENLDSSCLDYYLEIWRDNITELLEQLLFKPEELKL